MEFNWGGGRVGGLKQSPEPHTAGLLSREAHPGGSHDIMVNKSGPAAHRHDFVQ